MASQTDPRRRRPADAEPDRLADPSPAPIETERPAESTIGSPMFDPSTRATLGEPRPARTTGWQRPAMIILGIVLLLLVLVALF